MWGLRLCKPSSAHAQHSNTVKMAARGRRLSTPAKRKVLVLHEKKYSVSEIVENLKHDGIITTRQGIHSFLKHKSVTRRPRKVGCGAKVRPVHMKFLNMWLQKNGEMTARNIQDKMRTVFGLKVSRAYACVLREKLGWRRTAGRYCQQISHKNKMVWYIN